MEVLENAVRIEITRTKEGIEQLRQFWSSHPTHRDADIDFYLFTISHFLQVRSPYVIALYRHEQLKALVLGRLENKSFQSKLGYWRFRTAEVPTLTFIAGCVVGTLSEDEAQLVARQIAESLKKGEALVTRFEAIDSQSILHSQLTAGGGLVRRNRPSLTTIHYARRIDRATASFVESLSTKTRYNYRRSAKRLVETFPEAFRIEPFVAVEDVGRLMQDAESVARKSYQRQLGVGFVASAQMRARLEFEAGRGWLRAYVLYINEQPCAYWIGSLHRGTFYSDFMGYDPYYSKNSPGMYIVIKILDQLTAPDTSEVLTDVDFGAGEAEWKATLSDRNWHDVSVYAFAPTGRGLFLNILHNSLGAVDRGAKALLSRGDLIMRVKKYWRRRLQKA